MSVKGRRFTLGEANATVYLGVYTKKCSCEATIIMARSAEQRWHPFNDDGTSHFTTCPHAARYRRDQGTLLTNGKEKDGSE